MPDRNGRFRRGGALGYAVAVHNNANGAFPMHRLISTAAGLLLVSAVAGAATPQDAIKYRQAVMNTMSGHVSAINLIFTGKVEHQDYLLSHAEALAAAGDQIGKLFPAGSNAGDTDALPAIWADPAKFQKAADAGRTATAALRDAVKSGDKAAIGRSLKPVFDSCKGCHDSFREED
jgi:cytochrome c556